MQDTLFDRSASFFEKVNACDETKRLLRGYVQNYDGYCQFDVKDDEPFYVRLRDGNLTISKGRVLENRFDCPKITTSKEVLLDVLEGRIRPATAHRERKWLYSCRDRRGGMFTTLIRIGQDLVRNEKLERG